MQNTKLLSISCSKKIKHLYIHVPFCKSKCVYCDFYSEISGNENLYIDALIEEFHQNKHLLNEKLNSIFFGGGTPSLLSENSLIKIFNELTPLIKSTTEITFECNPDDISNSFTLFLKNIGINRISLGVQTLNDNLLQILNRRHNSQKTISALESISKYFNNFSCDLIYDIPNQANTQTADDAVFLIKNFNAKHLSAYGLTLDERHPLKELQPDDDFSIQTREILENEISKFGFSRYEVSNYSLNKKFAIHNLAIWRGENYLGLGPSAASTIYDGEIYYRKVNFENLQKYCNGEFLFEKEELNQKIRQTEVLMTSLRTKWGVKEACLPNKIAHTGKLEDFINRKNQRISLNNKGLDMFNTIAEKLLY